MNSCRKFGEMVIHADTPEELLHRLIKCGKLLKTGHLDRTAFLSDFKNLLDEKARNCRSTARHMKISGLVKPNVSIYDGMNSYFIFMAFNMGLCRKAHEIDYHIAYIADFFGNCLTKPKGGMLTPVEAEVLLDIVQNKFGLLSAATFYRDLDIYIINKSHVCYDSFLLTYNNADIWRNKWMLFCLSPCFNLTACNKYFVFLHEIGHILYNVLTGNGEDMPELFREVAFLLGLPIEGDNVKPDELFADIFSAASLYNTCYSGFNPFKDNIPESFCEFLELYYRMLVSRIDRENYQPAALSSLLQ